MNDFGKQLRIFREQSKDPQTGRRLSQEKLGALLFDEIGIGYTGAAVSEWELGKSRIGADDRALLLSLIKILKRCGGIKFAAEADRLLEAGNFRALNQAEREKQFPPQPEANDPPSDSGESGPLFRYFSPLIPTAEFDAIWREAQKGPAPALPHAAAAILRKITDRASARDYLRAMLWLWIWMLAYFLVAPSLQWTLMTGANAWHTVSIYALGSLALPPLIGAMTGAGKNEFWREKGLSRSPVLHLYVHQGAFIGFHVGYFLMFLLTSFQNLLGAQPATWVEFLKMGFPVAIGYAGAQLIPHNLWRAYGRLHWRDGGIFFIFALLGPLWALFFLMFFETITSPVMGAVVILLAMTLLAAWEARKR